MDSNTPAAIATFMGGATFAQGFAQVVTQNATFITTMSIALTAMIGLFSFIWGKINEKTTNKHRREARDSNGALKQN